MALNIKNPEVERLATELAAITGETKTAAIRKALEERKNRLIFEVIRRKRGDSFLRFLEDEVWPKLTAGGNGSAATGPAREEDPPESSPGEATAG